MNKLFLITTMPNPYFKLHFDHYGSKWLSKQVRQYYNNLFKKIFNLPSKSHAFNNDQLLPFCQ